MLVRLCTLLGIILGFATTCQAEKPAELARVTISGQVVDGESRAVSGVSVRGFTYADTTNATTDEEGRFSLEVIEERTKSLAILADDAAGDRMGVFKADWQNPPNSETPLEIPLAACRHLPVEVLTAEGEPAAGARVGAVISYAPLVRVRTDAAGRAGLRVPSECELNSLYASKPEVGFDYRVVSTAREKSYQAKWLDDSPIRFQLADARTIRIGLLDTEENPIVGTEVSLWYLQKPGEPDDFNFGFAPEEFRVDTDEKGVAEFRGVPNWDVPWITFWPNNKLYEQKRISLNPKVNSDGQLTMKLDRLVSLSGQALYADGRPAGEIKIAAMGAGYKVDRFRKSAKTDSEGRFQFAVTPNLLYMLAVQNEKWGAPIIDGLVVRPDEPIEGLKFKLQRATRVHGRVVVGADKNPYEGQQMILSQMGRSLRDLEGIELPNPENKNAPNTPNLYQRVTTDEEGRFEYFVGPGKFRLRGPSQAEAKEFEVTSEVELVLNFDIPRPEKGPLAGQVVTGDQLKPVADAVIVGKYRAFVSEIGLRLRADKEGRFAGERMLHATVLYAKSPDGKLAGIQEIGPDDTEVTISIGPLASATARLIDPKTNEPLPNEDIQWGRTVHLGDEDAPFETAWGGSTKTDATGHFMLKGLVVGQEYSMSVEQEGGQRYSGIGTVTPVAAEIIELGDLELSPPYKPPTFEERMEKNLVAEEMPLERYEKALDEAEKLHQHVLVVFLERGAVLTDSWFKLKLDDSEVRVALADYQLIQVASDAEGVGELAGKLGIEFAGESLPVCWLGDASGAELEAGKVSRLDNAIDKTELLASLTNHAPKPLDAKEILEKALAEAKKSDRLVIVQETATWCGPCHRLSRYLESQRSILEKDYLWIKIDRRWDNSKEVMEEIYPDKRGGIPWYAIIDHNKGVMATSDGPNGNIGFPTKPDEIDHFLVMLESTMLRMTTEDLDALKEGLESN